MFWLLKNRYTYIRIWSSQFQRASSTSEYVCIQEVAGKSFLMLRSLQRWDGNNNARIKKTIHKFKERIYLHKPTKVVFFTVPLKQGKTVHSIIIRFLKQSKKCKNISKRLIPTEDNCSLSEFPVQYCYRKRIPVFCSIVKWLVFLCFKAWKEPLITHAILTHYTEKMCVRLVFLFRR